ncbi:phosphotransferase enzyme family protein [Phycisphaera mikurensis]|uniref:Aminoglycoside phosphotransferase domain-containing protein n=1 Tax=Phycisphaera mikurensis (strain NBRC 102666 / KCTC 22515 / FYK2301M01) TaxID=1142394 RepID=I0IID8_PHYMF|nr:phosphotransferase [Phycisphaera mikurensis]MBB6442410.1 homoserine kinase type II [Phycisphaera mikurensis]BAM05026.1 hypothetical protein PSMK_28670 [Phycisphaera mikurensis NBRC 102666]
MPPDSPQAKDTALQPAGRQTFAAFELASVLSHYDLGVIEEIHEFPKGSRKAPKLILKTDAGEYLLKRRAPSAFDREKAAFTHGLQVHLANKGFPLPRLMVTRSQERTMLRLSEQTYEVFQYIRGDAYDFSLDATRDSGQTLGIFHGLLQKYASNYTPPRGSYHASRSVMTALGMLEETLTRHAARAAPPEAETLERMSPLDRSPAELTAHLRSCYVDAVRKCESLGIKRWPSQVIHADWHGGNMLFRARRVVAVIDYDTSRYGPRVIDTANGALQFSMSSGGADPTAWGDGIEEDRFAAFLSGYDDAENDVLAQAELAAIPHLMIEALLAESVLPIAQTGFFARMDGQPFLSMIRRKVGWIRDHAERLVSLVE